MGVEVRIASSLTNAAVRCFLAKGGLGSGLFRCV